MIRVTLTIEKKFTFDGTDLALERERLCLTQQKLSEMVGIKQQNLAAYERPGPVTIREHTKELFESAGVRFDDSGGT